MSIVAYDGKVLAADRQAMNGDLPFETRKIIRLENGDIIAWTGSTDGGLAMKYWYEQGCNREEFPSCQRDKDIWSRLIVVPYHQHQIDRQSRLRYYEQGPDPIFLYESFMAWGSGRDVAMGALAMGATASKAVEIACRYNVYCGMGIDVIEIPWASTLQRPKGSLIAF